MDKERFGRRVRDLREGLALTQKELADKAGVSGETVGRIERGEFYPFPRTRRKLAEALEVDVRTLR